jgi:hypothetical protein
VTSQTKRRWSFSALLVGYLTVTGVAWLLRDGDAAQTSAVILSGAVLLWYTWETSALRGAAERQIEAAQRQIELQLRPFVVLRVAETPWTFTLSNEGPGLALTIRVNEVCIGTFRLQGVEHKLTLRFSGVALLRPLEIRDVKPQAFIDGQPSDNTGTAEMLSAHLDPRVANQELTVTLRYENVEGREYASRQTTGPQGLLRIHGHR